MDWETERLLSQRGHFLVVLEKVVHHRMPVILDPGDYDLWLDPGIKDTAAISQLLKPFDARLMRCYPVSIRVNLMQSDDAECSAQVRLEPAPQSRVFG